MGTTVPDLSELKSRMKASWMAGDFGQIANFSAHEAENFVNRIGIQPNAKVLDVACGTGNTTIPAAKTGASVIGVDIAPNLLEQARKRALREEVSVDFREGDVEALPFEDQSFDVVLTMFGAMFAREMVDFFRRYFGPTQMAFSRLDPAGQQSFAEQMEALWAEHNTATDGGTSVKAEYLDVRAIRA